MTSSEDTSELEIVSPLRAQTVHVLETEIKKLRAARLKLTQTIKSLEILLLNLSPKPESLEPTTINPKPKVHEHVAIQAYRDAFHSYPQKSQYKNIVESVGETPEDVAIWLGVCQHWSGQGWNPKNITGLLEMYNEAWTGQAAEFELQTIDGVLYRVYPDGEREIHATTPVGR